MNNLISFTGLLFVAAALNARPNALVFQDSGEDWAELYVSVPAAEFSYEHIRNTALELLHSLNQKGIIKIVIASDSADILHLRKGKAMADYSYELWADTFAEKARERMPLAMAIDINGDAVLRFRDTTGHSTDSILRGRNPLMISIRGRNLEIRHVSFSKVPFGKSQRVHIALFIQADQRLSIERAREFAEVVHNTIPIREQVLILIREDTWFLANEAFPPFDLFTGSLNAPNLREYICSGTFVCTLGTSIGSQACRKQEYAWGVCQ